MSLPKLGQQVALVADMARVLNID